MGVAVSPFVQAFALAWVVSLALTPLARLIAVRAGFVVLPGEQRIHLHPLPQGGGVPIYIAFWTAMALAGPWNPQWTGFWLASTVILLVGLIDDARELRWHVKLMGQLAAAAILLAFGERIEFITNPFDGSTIYIGLWGIPVTLLWVVGLTNMVNLIDGLDGLAAGVCAIATIPLCVIALAKGRPEAALMTLALAGSALGFLPFNFNPAKLIMGDAGAMFLGFALATISVEGALKGPAALALIVPILALGLPILDTLFSVARRFASGRPVYARDRDHLHHRLLALGLNQREAVLTLYALSGMMGLGAIVAHEAGAAEGVAVFVLVAIGAILFTHRVGGLRGVSVQGSAEKESPRA